MTQPRVIARAVLVGIPEIAGIADVGPSAVGNWRKRHADFPKPRVQAPSGALFDLDEVERWLIENGKISSRVPASVRLRALTDTARGVWPSDLVSRFCVACLVYFEACARAEGQAEAVSGRTPVVPPEHSWRRVRETAEPTAFIRALVTAAQRLEELNPELHGLLVPGFSQLPPADGVLARSIAVALDDATDDDFSPRFALFDEGIPWAGSVRAPARGRLSQDVLAGGSEADRFTTSRSTPPDLEYLLVQLVQAHNGVIFDPAAGECGVLLLAALAGGADPKLVGIEIDEDVWRMGRSRCYLYEVEADIRLGDALTMDLTELPEADCVVLDPPYNMRDWGNAELYIGERWRYGPPPPRNANYAWLQIAVGQLKPDGRGAVVLPAGSLQPGTREAAIWHEMLDAGVIEGVILLPPRLRLDTSIPLAIWLLRSPDAARRPGDVLMVDASELATPGRSRHSLDERVIDRLGGIAVEWRSQHRVSDSNADIAVAVPVQAVAQTGLDPKRYRRTPEVDLSALEGAVEEKRQRVTESLQHMQAALRELGDHLEGLR